jgi:hypothetical protein
VHPAACKLLAQAVEAEAVDFLANQADLKIEDGRQRIVRHDHLPARTTVLVLWRSASRACVIAQPTVPI